MVRGRRRSPSVPDPSPARFQSVVGRGRGLSGLRLQARAASVSLSVRSVERNELLFEFGATRPGPRRFALGARPRRARLGGLDVRLDLSPLSLSVGREGREVFEIPAELPAGKLAGPSPWGVRGSGIVVPLHFAPGERIYGAGEFFGPVDRSGQRLTTRIADVYGLPNDGTYVTYPFFWSTRGYALLAETWAPVRLDFGSRYRGLGEMEIPRTPVRLRLFVSDFPREIVRWFWSRRGAPAVPPLWSYGLWYSRCAYRSQHELLSVARRVRSLGLPGDVIHLDPPWLDEPLPDALYAAGRRFGLSRRDVDRSADRDPGDVLAGLASAAARRGESLPFFGVGSTFRWNRRRFPDPAGMIRTLHERNFRLSLWIDPYVPAHTPEYRELARRGLFVRRADGKVGVQFDLPSRDFGAVDFTHPDGRRWFADRVRELVRLGVDVIKTDFGEAIPDDARAHAGGPPELHNRYSTLYNETVFRAVRAAGGEPMVWGRSGGLDIHRYPVQWGGDPRTHPRDMAAALRGALGYAASGGAFTSFDSGGFGGRPSPELYARWSAMGLFFSHTRLHGTTPREPWRFGRAALAAFRKFARARYRLIPYLYAQSVEGVRVGRPLVRPIAFDYPRDPVAEVDDEYLLGEDLLIAPVVPGSLSPTRLPPGEWFDFWTGVRIDGPLRRRSRTPLDELPVFVRSGAAIPLTAREHDHISSEMLEDLVVRTYGDVRSVRLDFGPHGAPGRLDLRRRSGRSGRFRWVVERAGR